MKKQEGKLTRAQESRLLRNYYLLTAAHDGVPFVSDGVTIDLSCELDPKTWQAVCPPGFYSGMAALHGPEIVFPWTPASWRAYFEKQGSIVRASKGSRVFVASVASLPAESPFNELDHPANRERRIAFLAVESPSHIVTPVRRGVLFLRRGAIMNSVELSDWSRAYRGMLERLESVFGVADIEDVVDLDPHEWPRRQDGTPQAYSWAFLALRDRNEDLDGHAMAAFGYVMGRAEAEEQLLASAQRGLEATRQVRKASSAKAAKDRIKSEPIRSRAAEIVALEPAISLTQCAKRIARELDKDERWIARTIKELFERRGDRKEYRPKPR